MNARTRILRRVQTALGDRPLRPQRPSAARREPPAELLPEFVERLHAVQGEWARLPPDSDPLDIIATRLKVANAKCVALGGGLPMQRLGRGLGLRGFSLIPPDASTDEVATADAGVTFAQWGIAETGTVVLDERSMRARRASLLPPLHIVVLPQSCLLATLDDLLAQFGPGHADLPSALTLITGPSRTADIELQLVVGVHGPRELLVVLA